MISKIDPKSPTSYVDKIFLTFDMDWAEDQILEDTIDLVEEYDVEATWFITNETQVLSRLRENEKFELGLHPNFNFLFEGEGNNRLNARKILEKSLSIVPEAVSLRSHGVTQGGYLSSLFAEYGLSHESNDSIPFESGINLKPYFYSNGLIKVPYFWADEHEWTFGRESNFPYICDQSDLCCFDFHPIHVFLNTSSSSDYENSRDKHRKPHELLNYRSESKGTRNKLIEILELMTEVS